MKVEKLVKSSVKNFVQSVNDKRIEDAILYWDSSVASIFVNNFMNFYELYKCWEKKEIIRVVEINKNAFLIGIRFSKKKNWLSENRKVSDHLATDNNTQLKNTFEMAKIIQFYTVIVKEGRAYINWSYASLKYLLSNLDMHQICLEHIDFYSDRKIETSDKEKLNKLNEFIKDNFCKNMCEINKVKVIWQPNKNYPFIGKSAFLEPTSGNIYIFRNYLDIECLKHEAVHSIFWDKYKVWPKAVIREGIASAFGSREIYLQNLSRMHKKIEFYSLFDESEFWNGGTPSLILSGLFVKFLLYIGTKSQFERLYEADRNKIIENISIVYGKSLSHIKMQFVKWLNDEYGVNGIIE